MSVTLALLAALTGSTLRDASYGSCPQRMYPIVALLPRADATDVPLDASIWAIDNCSPCADQVRLIDTTSGAAVPLARVPRETSAGHCELPAVHVTVEAAPDTITFAEDDLGSGRRGFALGGEVLTAPALAGDFVSFVLITYDVAGNASAPSEPFRVDLPRPPDVDDDEDGAFGCTASRHRSSVGTGAWLALLALRRRRQVS